MKTYSVLALLLASLSLSSLSCGIAGRGSGAAFSEDDGHKCFQAASMSGDVALIREVSRRLCISVADGASQGDFDKFVEEHKAWAIKNALFVARLGTAEEAKNYLASHMPPSRTDCPSPKAASATHDACSLISWADVTQVTGMPVGYTSSVKEVGDESECSYRPTKGSLRGVMILAKWRDGAAEMKSLKEEMQGENQDGNSLKPVAGVGDEAYTAGEDFYARRNEIFVTIRVEGVIGNKSEKAKQLAQIIVDRL
jgi:hypothetical protein